MGATASRFNASRMRSDSVEAADPEDLSGESSSLGSGDLSKQDVIFSYDSLWNDESMAAWESEQVRQLRENRRITMLTRGHSPAVAQQAAIAQHVLMVEHETLLEADVPVERLSACASPLVNFLCAGFPAPRRGLHMTACLLELLAYSVRRNISEFDGDIPESQNLSFKDVELATAAASPVRRRRGESKGRESDPTQPTIASSMDAAGNAKFLQAISKHDPKSAEFVARMLSSNIEADSLGGSGFTTHMGVLLEQFLLQVLFPFHLPFTACFYSNEAFRNMNMALFVAKEASGVISFVLTILTTTLTLLPLVLFYAMPELIPRMYQVEVWVLFGAYVLQNFIIALKYATMPEHAYEVLMTRDVPSRVRSSEQLITGWLRPSSIVLTREILETASRLGVDLDAVKFAFHPSSREAVARLFHSVERLLPPRLHVDFDPDVEIPMAYVLFSILAREVVRRRTAKTLILCSMVAVVFACVFPVLRALNGVAPFGIGPGEIAVHVATSFGVVAWFSPLVTFMMVAIKDYHMRCKTQAVLGSLISRKRNRADGRFFEPLLDIKACPGNVSAFVLARRMLLSVGERYSLRLQILTSMLTLVTLGFGVGVLAVTASQPSGVGWGAFEVFTMVELSVVGVFLTLMLMSGAGANKRAEEHVALLSARQMEVRQNLVAYHAIAGSFRMRSAKMAMMQSLVSAGGAAGAAVRDVMQAMAKQGMHSMAAAMAAHKTTTTASSTPGTQRSKTITSSLYDAVSDKLFPAAGAAITAATNALPHAVRMHSEGGPDTLQTIADDSRGAEEELQSAAAESFGAALSPTSGAHSKAALLGHGGDLAAQATRGPGHNRELQHAASLGGRISEPGPASIASLTPRRSRRSSFESGKLLTPTELLDFARAGADTEDRVLLGPNGGPIECELHNVIGAVEDLDRLLEPAKEAIRADALLHPVRLLGLPATMNLLRSGIVILSTCFSLALRLLWI